MPLYSYKGYDIASGAPRKGKVDAESPKAARQKLRQRDRVVVSDLSLEAASDKSKGKSSMQFMQRVTLQDLANLARQFATLQQAHVPLDESLKALVSQSENIVLRNTMSEIKDKVSEGKSLAEAMQDYPGVFNRLFVNMIRAGESSGTLGVVLERMSQYFEKQVAMRGQIFSAMTYPLLMIVASFGIIAYLFLSVVPKLQKIFSNLKVTLPWYTKMLINLSQFLQNYWFVVIAIGFVAVYGFNRWHATPKGKFNFDTFALRVPLFGSVVLRVSVAQFTQTLSTLLTSGVPIIQALEITKNVVSNSIISGVIEEAKVAVQEGQSLATCVEKSGKFPALVTHMIATGEKTGQLEEMLQHVSTAYEAEVERKIDAMVSLIEPLMIIIMGGITVVIVMAMLIPMLSIMNQVR